MKSIAVYTLSRLAVIAVLLVVGYAVGLRSYLLVFAAVVLGLPISYLLLRRQRDKATGELARRAAKRSDRKASLRSQLRGDDDAAR